MGTTKSQKTEQEWRERLTPEQYRVLREKGTEPAFSGALWNEHGDGIYRCAACGAELFRSDEKFESGTGWPSFWDPAKSDAVELHDDRTLFMHRVEVTCAACGSHLGTCSTTARDPRESATASTPARSSLSAPPTAPGN
jgi:peptide-methionine (R)-S-oxide reductase